MRIPNGPGSPCGIGLASTHRCRGCTRRPSSLGFQIMLARFLCWLSRHFASRLAGTARYCAATPMHRRNGRNRVRRSIPICLYTLHHGIRHPTWPAPSQENQRDTARTNLTAILVAVESSGIEQFALGLPLPETRRSERVPVGELHADIVAQDLRELPAGRMQACMPRKDAHLKPETTGDAADIVTRHQDGPGRQVTDVP